MGNVANQQNENVPELGTLENEISVRAVSAYVKLVEEATAALLRLHAPLGYRGRDISDRMNALVDELIEANKRRVVDVAIKDFVTKVCRDLAAECPAVPVEPAVDAEAGA